MGTRTHKKQKKENLTKRMYSVESVVVALNERLKRLEEMHGLRSDGSFDLELFVKNNDVEIEV